MDAGRVPERPSGSRTRGEKGVVAGFARMAPPAIPPVTGVSRDVPRDGGDARRNGAAGLSGPRDQLPHRPVVLVQEEHAAVGT